MSYILDALTKSQQERREGGVPTLSTLQLTVDPAKRAPTRYTSGALILLTGAAVLFVVYTLIWQDDGFNVPPHTAADAPTGTTPAAPVVAPSLEPSPAAMTPALPPLPSRPLRLTGRSDIALTDAPTATPQPAVTAPPPMSSEETAVQSIEERLFPGADAVHPETARLVEDLLEMSERPVSAPSVVVPDEPPLSDVISLPASAQAGAPIAPSAALARAEVMPTAPPAPAAGDVLPGVRALPSDVQASLGRLSINAHVYDDVPAGRMVIINMNSYREGEILREGPRVDAITLTGAVLSYQSHRFHLNVR